MTSLNQKGTSLVEVLVSLMLILIAAGAMATASYFMTANLNRVDQKGQTISVIDEVRMALGTRNRCTANLIGTSFAMATKEGSPVARRRITHFDTSGAPQSDVAVLNGEIGTGLRLVDLRVVPIAQLEAEKFLGDLVIDMDSIGKSDPTLFARRIPLQLTVRGGLIESCSLSGDDDAIQIQVRICEVTSAGNSQYNPETGLCEAIEGEWFPGTRDEASCPAGWKLPPGANEWAHCGVDSEGVVDNSPLVSRNFEKRGVHSVQLPSTMSTIDVSGNKVHLRLRLRRRFHCSQMQNFLSRLELAAASSAELSRGFSSSRESPSGERPLA